MTAPVCEACGRALFRGDADYVDAHRATCPAWQQWAALVAQWEHAQRVHEARLIREAKVVAAAHAAPVRAAVRPHWASR